VLRSLSDAGHPTALSMRQTGRARYQSRSEPDELRLQGTRASATGEMKLRALDLRETAPGAPQCRVVNTSSTVTF